MDKLEEKPKWTREDTAREIEQRGIRGTLEAYGIDDKYLAGKLLEELNANEIKHFSHKGVVVSSKEVTAWDTRQRARMDAHQLRNDYPAEKRDITLNVVKPLVVIHRGGREKPEDAENVG